MVKYMFETVNEIKKCSECPLGDDSWKGCQLYSVGIPARYGYKEFDTGKPDWCKLQPIICNGEGLYDIYEPPNKEVSKHIAEGFFKSLERLGL